MLDSSPSKVNMQPSLPQTAGHKRAAPSLLPAFEPFSSSPGFPRPSKRRAFSPDSSSRITKYPTPVPTSETNILASSPPKLQLGRPTIFRAQSAVSERAPLSAVPTYTLPEDGRNVSMGRSSNSSDYQLSANRLISRVHVNARYIAATSPLELSKVTITCAGWNGVKVHCHGRTWDLGKGDSFTSETESAEIMLDVQDARVILGWPRKDRKASPSEQTESSWEDEGSPTRRVGAKSSYGQEIPSSPLRIGQRLRSPDSPTPADSQSASRRGLADLFSDIEEKPIERPTVKVFEDALSSSDMDAPGEDEDVLEAPQLPASYDESFSSSLSEPSEDDLDEHDPDEENDPIVHSFGPFGANILPRMEAFTTATTPQARAADRSKSPLKNSEMTEPLEGKSVPVVNHVVNQLAFSRLSSTPLSVIMQHLPEELRSTSVRADQALLSKQDLYKVLLKAECIGEIRREGKDAAGKPLESEFYYIPDKDSDEARKGAVVDGLRKPSLRNCRKQHKQYYWKKPRTP